MTVRRGENWGETGPIPPDAVTVASDRSAAEIVAKARRAESQIPPLVLAGGDLARTLGGGRRRPDASAATHVRADVGAVLLDGALHWFVAHLVARTSWLRGRVIVVANAAFLGDWNIAPRAHPGDGRLDVLDGDPSLGDRFKARRRLPLGTHVPHPAIATRRVEAMQFELEHPTPVHLDGARVGSARTLSVRVEAQALDLWI